MSQQLDAPSGDGPPSAHFPAVGDSMVVGIVDVAEYQQRDYDTGEPLTWPDGGPRNGKVVTGLVVSTSGTAGAGSERNPGTASPGDIVRFWCEGSRFFTYRDAIKEAGGVHVGDVMLWKREADKAPTNPRHNPAKQYSAKIRRPEPKDGDLADRCERARIELKQRPALDGPVVVGGWSAWDAEESAPF
jgi:hypothetical protein